ncbi:hypothetical protein Vadar_011747 [Vaccinium darrowii]|uniref:Uncharacterized protein n=1 Tax=Vaccinium darrowii TaxID=229202 RepID=A0ACB7Y6H1_9ERIC|nr:hypothetical protein Vadar_011747 [Vaccinium darrowii]
MTGLPVDGKAVTDFDGDYEQTYITYLKKNSKWGRTGCVKLNWLRDNFMDIPETALNYHEEFMYYVRAYVLYIIGTIIVPDKTGTFALICYLPLLKDVTDFNKYAWGAALLAHLHHCLDNWLDKKSDCLAGHTYSLTGKDVEQYVETLRNRRPDQIIWEPYKRLRDDFLPQHLAEQQQMGLSRTILVCFDKAVHHLPNHCPKQFGLIGVGGGLLIADWPIPAHSDQNESHSSALDDQNTVEFSSKRAEFSSPDHDHISRSSALDDRNTDSVEFSDMSAYERSPD